MAKGTVRVAETGSVNELRIENTGDEDVYVQSGDMVKGGRQDRVLTVSFVLPRKSGEMPVAAYCVEHGRWSQRGAEEVTTFAGAYNALPSREAKLAMKAPLPRMCLCLRRPPPEPLAKPFRITRRASASALSGTRSPRRRKSCPGA